MSKIKIEWLEDQCECETCGFSYATGARVYVDGVLNLDLTPCAACFDSTDHERSDVIVRTLECVGLYESDVVDVLVKHLEHLGHEVEQVEET